MISIPYLTAGQMREVDRLMVAGYRIELIQMMENAGRNLAALARRRFLDGEPIGKCVVILAGSGGNGGGALVCARHLHNWGAQVHVALARPPEEFAPAPAHQLDILRRMRVPVTVAPGKAQDADLIVDGLIGYSLSGAPKGAAAELIRWANAQAAPVLALDVPSGLDATTGALYEPAIEAAATMTLALPKTGLRTPQAQMHVGELYLADIGVPPSLYAKLGLNAGAVFAREEIVRLR